MMKVYFAGSIRGATFEGKEAAYAAIVAAIKEHATLISEHSAVTGVEDKRSDWFIHRRDCNWIMECHCMIAEVSAPSLGVGYEIKYADSLGTHVLCLYKEGVSVSAMILGDPELFVKSYKTVDDIPSLVGKFLEMEREDIKL